MDNSKIKIFILCGALTLIYVGVFVSSLRGWGYAGYGGSKREDGTYRRYARPSIFYWGGATYYSGRSLRRGSLSGPSSIGGGPGLGK